MPGKNLTATGLIALCAMTICSTNVFASDLFTADVTIGQGTPDEAREIRGFSQATDVLRFVESNELDMVFPRYNDNLSVSGLIDFRGLDMLVSFAEHSPTLRFEVESLAIDESFHGQTREESVDQFVDFLKRDGNNLLNKIHKELARVSPVDPIAGNPNSLQSSLVNSAFDAGAFDTERSLAQGEKTTERKNLIGFRVRGGRFDADNFSGTSISVPLSYTINFDSYPGMKLKFKVPLAYVAVEGADMYSVAPGLGLTVPVMQNWALTASLDYGLTGSYDAASVGQILGGAVTSSYNVAPHLNLGELGLSERARVTLGNMVGRFEALKLSIGDYEFDPGISNTVFKNGVMVEHPLNLKNFGIQRDVGIEASYAHTYFAGSDLYMNHVHELSFGIGSSVGGLLSFFTDRLTLGVTYTFGDGYDSVTGNLGYTF